MNKLLLTALLSGVVALSGCSSLSQNREELKKYDDNLSYAMNVTRQFWIPKFNDAPVPKGVNTNSSAAFTTNVGLSTLQMLSGPRMLPGSFGLDIGFAILGELGKEKPVEMQQHILAFVDAEKFPDRYDAELEATRVVYEAMLKSFKSHGFTHEYVGEPQKFSFLFHKNTIALADLVHPALGCPSKAALEAADESTFMKICDFQVWVDHESESSMPAVDIPAWMPNAGKLAWPIWKKAFIKFDMVFEKSKADENAILAEAASYLPDTYWLYVQPKVNPETKKYGLFGNLREIYTPKEVPRAQRGASFPE